jgi:hypothetical protein
MWNVRFEPEHSVVVLRLTDHVGTLQMREVANAHARALECTARAPFRLLLDLRGMVPLEAEAASLLANMKRVATSLVGYRGCVVLADSPTIAMQQHRTRGTPAAGEVITMDPDEARRLLESGLGDGTG